MQVKVEKDLMQSSTEDFGLQNVREYFPEDELTLGKNRLLEVDSIVDWECMELIGIKSSSKLL